MQEFSSAGVRRPVRRLVARVAPYFPSPEPHKFINAHKVFGASSISKRIQDSRYAPIGSLPP
jgi:hypothetical protein